MLVWSQSNFHDQKNCYFIMLFVCSFIRNISATFSYSSGEVVSVNICMALLRWVFRLPWITRLCDLLFTVTQRKPTLSSHTTSRPDLINSPNCVRISCRWLKVAPVDAGCEMSIILLTSAIWSDGLVGSGFTRERMRRMV